MFRKCPQIALFCNSMTCGHQICIVLHLTYFRRLTDLLPVWSTFQGHRGQR